MGEWPLLISDVIAITGHRDYADPGALYRGLDNLAGREYVFGGARGTDSDALRYMARTQPHAVRTVVVPNRAIDQPSLARMITDKYATRVIELKNTGPDRYMIRNRYMVDRSTHTRAFYDHRGSGGTYNTIQYAKSQGKPYDIWTTQRFETDKFMRMSDREFRDFLGTMKENNVNVGAFKGIAVGYIKEFNTEMTGEVLSFIQNIEIKEGADWTYT